MDGAGSEDMPAVQDAVYSGGNAGTLQRETVVGLRRFGFSRRELTDCRRYLVAATQSFSTQFYFNLFYFVF